ncbi:MAG: LCP family protein [Actinomycetota bacterium]|nr:LCP family protein [Actinomycetota bacterium]
MSVSAAPPQRSLTPPPTAPPPAPAAGPPRDPPSRRSAWRLLLGCLIVLLCAMGAGAAFVLGEVHTLRDALNLNSALRLPSDSLAPVGWGDPETLLLVGDDQRALTQYYHVAVPPHANEMLLVRIDPSKPYISMMSIPRELQVRIDTPKQGPITTRMNYAYTAGGIPLLVSTVKRVLGVSVNHVIVITFARFKRAVDEMGCVYTTVDRRYFHVNVPGDAQYQEINLQPGYQNLCGAPALQFVSYRHGDTSLVRDARDQSFLLDVKKQYGPTLAGKIHQFEQIFGRAVQTDRGLHSSTGILNLAGTMISSAGRAVRQVQFKVTLAPAGTTTCECVTATPGQIAASVHSFLYGASLPAKQRTAAVAHAVHNSKVTAHLPLVQTNAVELSQAITDARGMPFAYEYPRVQDRGGSGIPVFSRNYLIHAAGGRAYPIYVDVFSAGQLGQYYDVQGTTWTGAPLFKSPQQSVTVGGRTYYLFYESEHLNAVTWAEHGAVYWVRNSLGNSIPNGELLAIAEETRPVGIVGRSAAVPRVSLTAAASPAFTAPPAKTDLRQMLGSLGGLLGLLVVPLLAVPLIKRRGQLRTLRAQLRATRQLEAELATSFARNPVVVPPLPVARPASAGPPVPTPRPAHPAPPPRPRRRDGASGSRRADPAARILSARRRRRRRASVLVAVTVLAAAGAVGLIVVVTRGQTPTGHGGPVGIPSSPVAVLNASTTQGAAGQLAQQLRGRRVKVGTVGNLAGWTRPGLWILFAPGQRDQAARLVGLVHGRTTVAPIDSVAQAAAGTAARVVVVIG